MGHTGSERHQRGGDTGEPEPGWAGGRAAEPVFRVPENQSRQEVWYLQILGSPLHAPAVALQGRLALLCGHPMHHSLQLGKPTHPSAPLGPLGLCPSLPSSQAWGSPSGSCLLAAQPLARPQGSPSVAAEQWPSGLVAGPLGCCL